MPVAAPRRPPPRLNKPGGPFKPVPRPSRKSDCCDKPEYETHEGTKICINCGTVKDDNQIVAEVTFGETSTGAATVQGGFVSETARHARTLGAAASRRIGGGQYQSREETEQNGRSELRQLCPQLRIPQHVEEIAFNLWKLAAGQNFIQGRRTNEVAGVCLYAACRRDRNNTILLMDISEALQVNVFKLGDIYKDLNKSLYLEAHAHITPVVEVEPLLMKYALKLEFGDDTRQIVEDAAKIIKRMKRDWMVTGRHPAGLCGACLILAARMNNHRRSVREVVFIVKVADLTVATRLAEFKNTRSSTMSVAEFRDKGLRVKHAHDPPSMNAAAERQRKLEAKKKQRQGREEARRSVTISSAASSRASSLAPSETAEPTESVQPQGQPASKRRRLSPEGQDGQTATPEATQTGPRRDADGFVIPDIPIDPTLRPNGTPRAVSQQPNTNDEESGKKKRGRPKGSKAPAYKFTDADFAAEHELEDDIENILQDPQCVSARDDTERSKLEVLAKDLATKEKAALLTAQRSQGRTPGKISDSVEIGEDEFADDPEVQNALLTDEQVKIKEKIWVAHNEDWLRAQQAKHLKTALDEAEGRGPNRPIRRRKRSKMGDGTVLTDGGTPVASPADAATRMLEKRGAKNWSKSVDYAALNRILGGGTAQAATPSESEAGSVTSRATSAEAEDQGAPAATEQDKDQQDDGLGDLPTPPDTQHAVVQGLAEAVDIAESRADRLAGAAGDTQEEPTAEADVTPGDKARDAAEDEGEDVEEEAEEEEEEEEPVEAEDFEAATEDITGDFGYGDEPDYGDDMEW